MFWKLLAWMISLFPGKGFPSFFSLFFALPAWEFKGTCFQGHLQQSPHPPLPPGGREVWRGNILVFFPPANIRFGVS